MESPRKPLKSLKTAMEIAPREDQSGEVISRKNTPNVDQAVTIISLVSSGASGGLHDPRGNGVTRLNQKLAIGSEHAVGQKCASSETAHCHHRSTSNTKLTHALLHRPMLR